MTAATFTACYGLLALGMSGAPPAAVAAPRPDVTVQLRVFPHAAVDAPTLLLTRDTVTALLASAGVGVEWRECALDDPACGSLAPSGGVVVRLLPSMLTSGHVCGQTVHDVERAPTVLVSVPRTTALARTFVLSPAGRSNPALATLEAGHLLGLTVAHEVGHALGLRHADSGLMKARFAVEDVLALRASRLAFTPREGALMRRAMLADGSTARGSITPFESQRPGEVIVGVTFGRRGPFRFLLDTGSALTAITDTLANELGAALVARTAMKATAGTVECVVVALPPLAVGDTVVEGLTATALPPSAASALPRDVDGVIGQDFLSRFRFTIDYRRSRIVWHAAGYVPPGVRLTLVPSQDRWLAELPQRGQGPPHRFVPDSGADPWSCTARPWRNAS